MMLTAIPKREIWSQNHKTSKFWDYTWPIAFFENRPVNHLLRPADSPRFVNIGDLDLVPSPCELAEHFRLIQATLRWSNFREASSFVLRTRNPSFKRYGIYSFPLWNGHFPCGNQKSTVDLNFPFWFSSFPYRNSSNKYTLQNFHSRISKIHIQNPSGNFPRKLSAKDLVKSIWILFSKWKFCGQYRWGHDLTQLRMSEWHNG